LPESIEKLVRRYINCRKDTLWKVSQLVQHIERSWEHVSSDEGDRTNNATEWLIGVDYKIRAKTMRGLKNEDKVLGHTCRIIYEALMEYVICDKWFSRQQL